jgi:hypothetical protein
VIGGWVVIERAGPVYLWWSEWCDRAIIGPKQGAWGGDDIYKCDSHPEWQGDDDDMRDHAALHGYFLPREPA